MGSAVSAARLAYSQASESVLWLCTDSQVIICHWNWHTSKTTLIMGRPLRTLRHMYSPQLLYGLAPPGRMGVWEGEIEKRHAAFCSQAIILGVKGSYSIISPLSPPVFRTGFFPRLLWCSSQTFPIGTTDQKWLTVIVSGIKEETAYWKSWELIRNYVWFHLWDSGFQSPWLTGGQKSSFIQFCFIQFHKAVFSRIGVFY